MSSRRPTSKDVAKLAGVSRTTVSFVLNNSANHSISEETAKRVRAAADKLGYMPFGTTRVLRKLRANAVLVLTRNQLDLDYPDEYRELLSNLLAKHQVSCLFAYAPTDRNQLINLCETVSPDAILLLFEPAATDTEILSSLGIPALSLPTEIATQGSDTGVIAATHLFQQGSHKILLVTSQASPVVSFVRECLRGLQLVANAQTQTNSSENLRNNLRKTVETISLESNTAADNQADTAGISSALNLSNAATATNTTSAAVTAAPVSVSALLQNQLNKMPNNSVLGICTHSTQIAMQLLRAAKELKIDIPNRLKLVVIGETQNSELANPTLTTVSVNLREQTQQIAKQLLTAVGVRAKNINIEDSQPLLPSLTHRETS